VPGFQQPPKLLCGAARHVRMGPVGGALMKIAARGSSGAATVVAVAAGCLALLAAPGISLSAGFPAGSPSRSNRSVIVLVQADENVTPTQLDKFIAVYKAMQHNHSLTVEQAAAAQGLTLRQFRDVEQRVEHNDTAREAVRRALAQSATQSSPGPKQRPRH
jgi:hypothetical protein